MRLWPRRRWARILLVVCGMLVVGGFVAWRQQSVIIGRAAEWYLSRVSEAETANGKIKSAGRSSRT